VEDSLIASGCVIEGTVARAILSPGVKVGPDAVVEDAILWDGVVIGPRAKVQRAIIEDKVRVPSGFAIGYDRQWDAARFHITETGIVVVPNNARLED
jgi:glucose-1-phosphate adenylyltransferase